MTTVFLLLLSTFYFLLLPSPAFAGELSNQFTISLWVNPQTSIATKALVVKDTEVRLVTDASGNPACQIYASGAWQTAITSSTALTLGTWAHVTCTYDKANMYVYINGVQTGTGAQTNALNDAATNLLVGQDDTAAYANFIGTTDQMLVYSYARTAKQIVEDMNAGHPAPGSPVGSAIGHWKFDEGADNTCSGGTNDVCNSGSQGSTLDGTSTATRSLSGKFGGALSFDGTDDVVTVANVNAIDFDTSLSNFSFTTWVNADSDGEADTGQIFQKGASTYLRTDSQSGSNLDIEANLDLATTDANVNVSTGITTTSWNHLAVTWNGTTLTVYINGVSKGTGTGSGAISSDANNLLIGGTTTNNFDGAIDEFKVYNYALTADEVKIDMNKGQAQVMGALSDNSSYQLNAANQEYCIPGDTTSCAAPVGRWDFEEGTGTTTNDRSGNAFTATFSDTPTWAVGKFGKSLNFDGTNDYLTISNSSSPFRQSSAITYSFWVNIPSGGGGHVMGTSVGGGHGSGGVYFSATTAYFVWTPTTPQSDRNYSISYTFTPNTWYHIGIAISFSGAGSGKIYVNGVPQTTTLSSSVTTATPATGYNCPPGSASQCTSLNTDSIGGRFVNSQLYFNGKLDNIRIYNYVRTPAQIAWDYNRGAPVGHWKFDECQGSVANDSSGNNNSGTITPGAGGQTAVGTCTGSANTMWKDGATGKYNSSLDFDGTDDYVDVGNPTALQLQNNFTLSAWVNLSGAGTNPEFIHALNSYGLGRRGSNGHLYLAQTGVSFDAESSYVVPLNAWVHLVSSVSSGNVVSFYANGQLVDTENKTTTYTFGSNVLIGGGLSATYVPGQIDDVRIYNYALTPLQIKTLYNGGAIRFGPVTGSP